MPTQGTRLKDSPISSENLNWFNAAGRCTALKVLMAYLIKWFRLHSFCGITLTAFFWIFLCYQVLPKQVSIDENNAFNLVEENFPLTDPDNVGKVNEHLWSK